MFTFICATCLGAGRRVAVECADRPTKSETHKAHRGYGLGLGNHNAAEMIREDKIKKEEAWRSASSPTTS